MSASRFCPACGAEVRPAARFCHRCGAGMDGQRPAGAGGGASTGTTGGTSGGASNILPWSVAGIALLCLLAFIVGQNFRKTPAAPAAAAGPFAGAAGSGGAPGRAPDISQMGPEERADRLFQRVMTYVAEGKSDSVQFFSPMAIQSMQALAPLDAHRRYDLGLLGMVSGDAAMARAQADSILSAAPNHLLGLVLAMRTAGMQLDSTARRGYAASMSGPWSTYSCFPDARSRSTTSMKRAA
ncbi:MAG: zinc ribbon domain-containing protein [Gemmatimonadota bacterium]